MKKYVIVLLILVLALSVCLTACNNEQDPSNQQPSNQEPSNQQPNDQEPSNQKPIDNSVTEQQWKDAFEEASNFDNKTYEWVAEVGFPGSGEYEKTTFFVQIEDIAKLFGGYEKFETQDENSLITTYYSKESDKYYGYTKESRYDDVWIRVEQTEGFDLADLEEKMNISSDILKNQYSNFTYNGDKKQYEAISVDENDMFDVIHSCVVRFNDGKLEYVEINGIIVDEKAVMTFTYSNYGTTSITLPSEYVEFNDYIHSRAR